MAAAGAEARPRRPRPSRPRRPMPRRVEKKGHGHGARRADGAPARARSCSRAAAIVLLLIGAVRAARVPAALHRVRARVLRRLQVVWNVTPALHTPLMSVTNAISSIIIIGALVQIAPPSPPPCRRRRAARRAHPLARGGRHRAHRHQHVRRLRGDAAHARRCSGNRRRRPCPQSLRHRLLHRRDHPLHPEPRRPVASTRPRAAATSTA